jgi:hydrogenase maturation protein HypF
MQIRTQRISIEGIVQGVGFRPFVYSQAKHYNITGYVANTPSGVEIIAQGTQGDLSLFVSDIIAHPPPQASVKQIDQSLFPTSIVYHNFVIRESSLTGEKIVRISPDLPLCDACKNELFDPKDRRYYYPFINCTNCGPRYTIVTDTPYDRESTTMSSFVMCGECSREYSDPDNRRFHAQPDACHACGPRIALYNANKTLIAAPSDGTTNRLLFTRIAALLEEGAILAIKGIGGFHLACDATNPDAVAKLRKRKTREAKPFAIMVENVGDACRIARVSEQERIVLTSNARPIVLVRKVDEFAVSGHVAPKTDSIGIMLAYAPIHYLIFAHFKKPLVMTSGNSRDEPIAYSNEEAIIRLSSIADFLVIGTRDIHTRCDDSVMRIFGKQTYPLRRSRGFVPLPVIVEHPFKNKVLAIGAEQKNTICFGKNNEAILSHHIGDLDNPKAFESFVNSIFHLSSLLGIKPDVIGYDLHPGYLNTDYILSGRIRNTFLEGLPSFGIQHHHAHIVSCMADNSISGEVIGIALDGTGYGTDNTIWGGEILLANEKTFVRLASLLTAPMPGTEASIKKPWRMALSYLYETFGDDVKNNIPETIKNAVPEKEIEVVLYQLREKLNSPLTSSCGRLFDGVSALAGICLDAWYEGSPAIELEQAMKNGINGPGYDFSLEIENDFGYISWKHCIGQIIDDIRKNVSKPVISMKFHSGLVRILTDACVLYSRKTKINRVVLSGGCFMNMFLLSRMTGDLARAGLNVYVHRQVPCNDGGLSLGQIVIADKLAGEQ